MAHRLLILFSNLLSAPFRSNGRWWGRQNKNFKKKKKKSGGAGKKPLALRKTKKRRQIVNFKQVFTIRLNNVCNIN